MFFTFEILLDAEMFVVFQVDTVASAVFFILTGDYYANATDEQDDSVALAVVTLAAVVVAVREEG
jgi:uncharacterized membrane protein